jgi:hypothetical protein
MASVPFRYLSPGVLYLLGLAVRRKGRFSSLDRHIPAELVQGGAEAFEAVFGDELRLRGTADLQV